MHTSWWRHLAVPLLAVVVAELLRPVVTPWLGPPGSHIQIFSIPAVFIAAWWGGLWSGVLAIALTLLVAFGGPLVIPNLAPVTADVVVSARTIVFIVVGLCFSAIAELHLRNQLRLALHREAIEAERVKRASADSKVAEERERLRLIADHIPTMLANLDREWRYKFVNRAYAQHRNLRPEDIIGRTALEVLGPQAVDGIRPHVERALAGSTSESEMTLQLPGREPEVMRVSHIPERDDSGAVVGWIAAITDITAAKRTEALLTEAMREKDTALAHFRALADSMPQIVWSLGPDGTVDYVNRRFFELAGENATPGSVIYAADRARVDEEWAWAWRTGRSFECEYRLLFPGETSPRWYLGRSIPVRDEQGAIVRWYGTSTDIHDQKTVEAQVTQSRDALRDADRQKDEFLGMLAHELRNPLAPVMYSVAILDKQIADPAAKRPLDVIARQVRRMSRIVDDLLDVSRVTQGKVSLKCEALDVCAVAAEVVEAAQPNIAARAHALATDFRDAPLMISGDTVRIAQIIENLVANAAKYTPPGGRIDIRVHRDRDDALIAVKDNGVGIDPAMLPRVFDLFSQAETSLDRSEGGLGIGLTLVDRLARLHSGRVEARSDGIGRGSEFIVRLPLLAVCAQPSADDLSAVRAGTGARILVVDDHVDSAEALGTLLHLNGHLVRLVHNGNDVLDAARDFRPALVLLDIGLPGMDGFQVARQLRADPRVGGVPIVATTGYGREGDRVRSLEAGFDDHLTKPADVGRIEQILAKVASRTEIQT